MPEHLSVQEKAERAKIAALAKLSNSDRDILDAAYASRLVYIVEIEERAKRKKQDISRELKIEKKKYMDLLGITQNHIKTEYEAPCCAIVIEPPSNPNGTPRPKIISFAGSDEAADWGINLNAIPALTSSGLAHGGFVGAVRRNNFGPKILSHQARIQSENPGCKVLVCGHSLGGALATVYTDQFGIIPDAKNIELYTYSAPPVGPDIAAHLNETLGVNKITNIAHRNDIVNKIGGNTSPGLSIELDDNSKVRGEYREIATAPVRMLDNTIENFFLLPFEKRSHSLVNLIDLMKEAVMQTPRVINFASPNIPATTPSLSR